jgi:hypothetical protein
MIRAEEEGVKFVGCKGLMGGMGRKGGVWLERIKKRRHRRM